MLSKKNNILVLEISVLTSEENATMHQDYFDMEALAYGHIPLLGGIGSLKE